MERFTNQVVVITGASSGIGRALCLALAPERPRLVLAARNAQRIDDVARACAAEGAETLAVVTDVTDRDQCRALIDRAVERFGRLDVLVNNAGQAMWAPLERLTDLTVLDELMRVNYLGSAYCTYFALPHLRQSRGRILAMASTSGLTGVPLLTGYAASKHAMIGFFESLRIELQGSGIGVTIAAPDFVQSPLLERAADADGRPLEKSPLDQNQMLGTERCARLVIDALRRRRRLVLTSLRSKSMPIGRLLAPELVDRISAGAVGWHDGSAMVG